MSELSPEAKQLLRQARAAFSPDAHRVATVRAALGARIGLPASTVPGGSAAVRGAARLFHAASWSASQATLAGVVAGLLGASGLALWMGTERPALVDRETSAEVRPVSNAIAVRPVDPATVPPPPMPLPEMAASQLAEAVPSALTDPALQPQRDHRLRAPRAPLTAPPAARVQEANSAAPADSLAEEIRLLQVAREALDRGDADRALALLSAYEETFPTGTLQEERLATRVLALCQAGRPAAARAAAQRLEQTAPRSPHLARIRASCVGKPPAK